MNQVVQWTEELARQAKEVASLERPSVSIISLKSGVMRWQDQPVPNNQLDVIVVASVFEHRWFKNRFDPDNIETPACFALSSTGRDMAPHEKSPEAQSDVCETCEKFQWNSADNGKGKACKAVRRLALLPVSSVKDGNVKTAEMAIISIPVTSVKNWANYANKVAAQYERPPWAVITKIKVGPHSKNQFEVTFETIGMVDDSLLMDMMQRNESATETLMSPYEPSEQAESAPEEKGKKKKY